MMHFPKKYNQPHVYFNESNFLKNQEVDDLLNLIKNIPYEEGKTGTSFKNQRTSKIKWLPQTTEFQFIYFKTIKIIHHFNSSFWRFKLKKAEENFQYTEYDSKNKGKYDWHIDLGSQHACNRKISITIELSDPSEYEGGELQLFDSRVNDLDFPYVSMKKEKGSITLFPSFTPHRVSPVTKGIRKSLVLWVGGTSFK